MAGRPICLRISQPSSQVPQRARSHIRQLTHESHHRPTWAWAVGGWRAAGAAVRAAVLLRACNACPDRTPMATPRSKWGIWTGIASSKRWHALPPAGSWAQAYPARRLDGDIARSPLSPFVALPLHSPPSLAYLPGIVTSPLAYPSAPPPIIDRYTIAQVPTYGLNVQTPNGVSPLDNCGLGAAQAKSTSQARLSPRNACSRSIAANE